MDQGDAHGANLRQRRPKGKGCTDVDAATAERPILLQAISRLFVCVTVLVANLSVVTLQARVCRPMVPAVF